MTSVGWRKAKDKETIDYDKLDRFIDLALSKYTYQEADKSLYEIAGEQAYFIINNNSLVPDLVIFNKTFNKNLCFHDFKGSSFNPFPRRKFKFEAKNPFPQENDEKRDNASNDSNDEIQWADTDINEMTKAFTFTKLPQEIEKEKEKDDIDELLNFKQEDISEVIHDELNRNIIEDQVEGNKDKQILEEDNGFDMNIFISDNKNTSSQPECNEMNDFDINLLTQMAQNVYGMTNDDSQDNQSISKDDESFKEATGIKSILNDDNDNDYFERKTIIDNVKEVNVEENRKASFTNNAVTMSNTTYTTNDKVINKNTNIHTAKPFIPNSNNANNLSSQSKQINQSNNNQGSNQSKTQNQQSIPLFPPQYLNYITNYYNQLQGNNPNQKTSAPTKDKNQDKRLSIDIDDPINIVYKNTMGRWWFIKSDNKLINANSYELLEFMEAYVKTGKDLFDLTITDYQTDMYFSPITLLENLREVIPQIKSAMLLQMQLGKVNSANQTSNQPKSNNQNGNKKKEIKK